MLGIKVRAKLVDVTHQIKSEDRFRSKKKARPGKHNLMG